MTAVEVIKQHMLDNGTKVSFLAEKSGLRYELLRRSLDGQRLLKADELLVIVKVLKLDLGAFRNETKTA